METQSKIDKPGIRSLNRADAGWVALLVCLVLVIAGPMLFNDRVSRGGDSLLQSLPHHDFFRKSYRSGQIPVWHPNVTAGAAAETMYTPHSPYYIFALPSYLWADPVRAYQIDITIGLLMIAMFFYIFARVSMRGSGAAAAAGAAIYLLNGLTITALDKVNVLHSFAWLPLILMCAIQWLETRRKLWIYMLAFGFGTLFFCNFIYYNLFAVMIIAAITLFWNRLKTAEGAKLDVRGALGLVFGLTLGGACALALLAPAFLAGVGAERAQWHWRTDVFGTLGFRHLISTILPGFFGSRYIDNGWSEGEYWGESVGFTGLATAVLVFYAGRRSLGRRGWFFVILGMIGLVLIFGARTPLGLLLFNMPVMHTFRCPGRFFFFWTLGLSAAAVAAFGAVETGNDRRPGFIMQTVAAASFLLLIFLLIFDVSLHNACLAFVRRLYEGDFPRIGAAVLEGAGSNDWSFYADKFSRVVFPTMTLSLAAGAAALAAAISIGLLGQHRKKLKVFLWIVLICGSLCQVAAQLVNYVPAQQLRNQPEYSRWVGERLGNNRFLPSLYWRADMRLPYNVETDTIYGLNLSRGYVLLHQFNNPQMPRWNHDCRYFATLFLTNMSINGMDHPSCMKGELVGVFPNSPLFPGSEPVEIYKVANPLPVAFLAPDYLVINDLEKIRELINTPDFDPLRTVIVDREAELVKAGVRRGAVASGTESVNIERPRFNRVIIKTKSDQPAALVLLDTWAKGWSAVVDGKKADILRAFGGFKAISLSGGGHTVKLVYRPVTLLKFLPFSLAAWLVVFVGICKCLLNRR